VARKKLIKGNLDTPATKQDILLLMDSIGKLYDANERWKNETVEETSRHFDVKCEELTHDFQGTLKDKISVHDDHLQRHDTDIHAIRVHVGMPM
jgi:hypothetical protein